MAARTKRQETPTRGAKAVLSGRRTDSLYHDAWMAMREGWQELAELDGDSTGHEFTLTADLMARACRQHLYRMRPYMNRLRGSSTNTLEEALLRVEALLIAVHAIAVQHKEDPDTWGAEAAIACLTRMLDEHTLEGAADRWAAHDRAFDERVASIGLSEAWDIEGTISFHSVTDPSLAGVRGTAGEAVKPTKNQRGVSKR